jgi:hypothetical protein
MFVKKCSTQWSDRPWITKHAKRVDRRQPHRDGNVGHHAADWLHCPWIAKRTERVNRGQSHVVIVMPQCLE